MVELAGLWLGLWSGLELRFRFGVRVTVRFGLVGGSSASYLLNQLCVNIFESSEETLVSS